MPRDQKEKSLIKGKSRYNKIVGLIKRVWREKALKVIITFWKQAKENQSTGIAVTRWLVRIWND